MAVMDKKFPQEMTRAREARGITKYRLAQVSGISEGLISRYESGKQTPADETVAKIADALGYSYDRLLAAAWADRHGPEAVKRVQIMVSGQNKPSNLGISDGDHGNQASVTYHGDAYMVLLPRYGPVSCGDAPLFEQSDAVEMVPVLAEWAAGVDAVFIVRGNCLSARRILDGDQLLVARLNGSRPPDGTVVLVEAEGAYSAKVFRSNVMGEYLESHEDGKDPQPAPFPDGTRLIGRVVRLVVEL